MIKLVCFFKAKEGVSLDEMREYYEENHVKLIAKLMPFFYDYRRSYVLPGKIFTPAHVSEVKGLPDFHVMTEVWCKDEEAYNKMLAVSEDPVKGSMIAEDEARFLDRSSMVMFLVDERITGSTQK